MPTWQAVGRLFAINLLLVIPLIPFGPRWQTLQWPVLALHLMSVVLLCGTAACIFRLFTRGRSSGVAVGQALAPAATLVAASHGALVVGTQLRPITGLASLTLMLGSLIPLDPQLRRHRRCRNRCHPCWFGPWHRTSVRAHTPPEALIGPFVARVDLGLHG